MSTEPLLIKRLPLRLTPDSRRTITRFFWPGQERAVRIVERVKSLANHEIVINDTVHMGLAVALWNSGHITGAELSNVRFTGNVSPDGPFTVLQDIGFQVVVLPKK